MPLVFGLLKTGEMLKVFRESLLNNGALYRSNLNVVLDEGQHLAKAHHFEYLCLLLEAATDLLGCQLHFNGKNTRGSDKILEGRCIAEDVLL